MSSKTTLFLTRDNEHCYEDCTNEHYQGGNFIGNSITLEMDKKNIRIIENNEHNLIVEIDPGSELYDLIKKMS